jgi:hypothetical protein
LDLSDHGHFGSLAGSVYRNHETLMNVLVFKTSVEDPLLVKALKPSLDNLAGEGKWNFDLSDCDKILRIASASVKPESTIELLSRLGIACAELES